MPVLFFYKSLACRTQRRKWPNWSKKVVDDPGTVIWRAATFTRCLPKIHLCKLVLTSVFSLKVDRKETGIAVRVVGKSCHWQSNSTLNSVIPNCTLLLVYLVHSFKALLRFIVWAKETRIQRKHHQKLRSFSWRPRCHARMLICRMWHVGSHWSPGARFSKLPVITGPVKLFCFPLQIGVSKVLNRYTVKLLAKETKRTSLEVTTRPTFLETLISKSDFGPVKLPGASRNGPQATYIQVTSNKNITMT